MEGKFAVLCKPVRGLCALESCSCNLLLCLSHLHVCVSWLQFGKGLEDIWGSINATIDFIVIGPLDEELHMSTR